MLGGETRGNGTLKAANLENSEKRGERVGLIRSDGKAQTEQKQVLFIELVGGHLAKYSSNGGGDST